MPKEKMVRCIDCGYLQLKRINSIDRDSADSDYRRDGTISSKGVHGTHDSSPRCYKGVPVEDECKPNDRASGFSVASKDRKCKPFFELQPGRTAERHDEMELLRDVQRMNREAADDAKILADRRHQESLDAATGSNKIALAAAVISGILFAYNVWRDAISVKKESPTHFQSAEPTPSLIEPVQDSAPPSAALTPSDAPFPSSEP